MPTKNKTEQNAQFFDVLKEILDTQSSIIEAMGRLEKAIASIKGASDPKSDLAKRWRNM